MKPFLALIVFYAYAMAARAATPTTQPGSQSAQWLAGWTAAGGQISAPAPAIPPAPVIPIVPLTADLPKVIPVAAPGSTIQLAAGTYPPFAAGIVVPAGVHLLGAPLDAGGKPTTTLVRKSVAGSTTGLLLSGAGTEVEGITFDSDKPIATAGKATVSVDALRVTASNCYIHDCVGRNVDDLVDVTGGAKGIRILHCSATNELRADGIYVEDAVGGEIGWFTTVTSAGGHGIRFDSSDGKTFPTGWTIHDSNVANLNSDESIAIRFGWNITITNNTLGAWARVNQAANPPVANVGCGNVTFTGNHFAVGAYIQINPYTTGIKIDGNTFDLDATHVGVAVAGPGAVAELSGNSKNPIPAGIKLKPLIHAFLPVTLTGADATDKE